MRDQRPGFHLTAPSGWLNDPNGPVHRDGRYHVFYQRNPLAPVWAPSIGWGHASSPDLVRWTHHPDALGPTAGGPDGAGCWSGCVVDDGGVPTAVYSGLEEMSAFGARSVCLARGDDELLVWRKDPRNPVIPAPPPGLDLVAFRDPFVWREDGGWALAMGAGIAGLGGAVLLYRSPDLVEWSYEGVLLSRDARLDDPWTGLAWECPQLFPLGGRHVLLVSVWDAEPPHTRYAVAFVGDLRDGRLEPERLQRFDHGADHYAPATTLDAHGRRLAWAWSWEARDRSAALEQGWAGALTLPRVLTLTGDGALGVAPAPELEALRGAGETVSEAPLGALLPETRGGQLELCASIDPGGAASIRLDVLASPGGEERTTIAWDRATGRLVVDRSRASLDPRALGGSHGGALGLRGGGALELRVLVDRSIVEVYANGRLALTERVYPTREDSTGVALSAAGGEALLRRLDVWPLSEPRPPRRP